MPKVKRVGHKGADLIAPGNSLASFDAAVKAGVEMIEFDVLAENRDGTGELLLAHDYKHVKGAVTLEQALNHFRKKAFAGIELAVDLKLTGYEERVVDALREHGFFDSALVCTMETESLPVLRACAPDLRISWSVPKVKRNYLAKRSTKFIAYAVVGWLRFALPRRLAKAVRNGAIDAATAHHSVVTPRFVKAMHAAGGELYVWTVDDAEQIAKFEAIGVDGIITNDPRRFKPR